MKRFERILVCIDDLERDSGMLAYVQTIARLAGAREIHLLHVAESEPAEAGITRESLSAFAAAPLTESGSWANTCNVINGTPLLESLRYAHDRDVDLIVIGRHCGCRTQADEEALLPRRLTRKATCSVLVLPEDVQVKIDKILAPIRDSACSAIALDVACAFAVATNAAVTALNIFQVHPGYSRVGTSIEEHEALLDTAAQHECDVLLGRVDADTTCVECKCASDLHGTPAPIILDTVTADAIDIVVIGARGRTGAAGVLLGKVTERLISKSPVPVLAVKKKGECLGVIQALMSLAGQ